MPPKPASRPECISTSVMRAAEISTWTTAKKGTIARGMVPAVCPAATSGHGRRRPRRPCEDPAPARDRGQPAQAGCQAGEGPRELHGGARGGARRPGSRRRCGRSSSSGWPISSGSKQKLLHPLRLNPDVVQLGGAPRRGVRAGERRGLVEAGRDGVVVPRVDEDARLRAARTRAAHRHASRRRAGPTPAPRASRARTARRRLGWQTTSAAANHAAHAIVSRLFRRR